MHTTPSSGIETGTVLQYKYSVAQAVQQSTVYIVLICVLQTIYCMLQYAVNIVQTLFEHGQFISYSQ